MPTPITMPQLGESVTEGVVARWLKAEGDHVERDEALVEIITDKVNAEMPSPYAGTLVAIVAAEGATVPVGGELAQMEVAGAAPSDAVAPAAASDATADAAPSMASAATAEATRPANGNVAIAETENGQHRRYSPVVRRLAQEHQIDLARVEGTGLEGRVTKDDVLHYISGSAPAQSRAEAAPGVSSVLPAAAPTPGPVRSVVGPAQPMEPGPQEEYLPLTPMRRAIAEHMVRSKQAAPHATTVLEVDMTRLVRWREANKEAIKARHSVDITFVALMIAATIDALRAFPIMNSSWGEDKIVIKKRLNIGIAVGLEDGLVVPVIHDADEKSIVGLARAVNDLAQRARANRLTVQDMQGGTFTVNNVGVFGAVISTPVINQPQAAILAMNAIVKRPVVVDDAIAIRSMMNLSLSFDHRIVDGLTSGRFLQRVAQNLDTLDVGNL